MVVDYTKREKSRPIARHKNHKASENDLNKKSQIEFSEKELLTESYYLKFLDSNEPIVYFCYNINSFARRLGEFIFIMIFGLVFSSVGGFGVYSGYVDFERSSGANSIAGIIQMAFCSIFLCFGLFFLSSSFKTLTNRVSAIIVTNKRVIQFLGRSVISKTEPSEIEMIQIIESLPNQGDIIYKRTRGKKNTSVKTFKNIKDINKALAAIDKLTGIDVEKLKSRSSSGMPW